LKTARLGILTQGALPHSKLSAASLRLACNKVIRSHGFMFYGRKQTNNNNTAAIGFIAHYVNLADDIPFSPWYPDLTMFGKFDFFQIIEG
jgi:hypothetical protein